MADAVQRDAWSRTARLCATIASVGSSKTWQPDDFMPDELKPDRELAIMPVSMLHQVFKNLPKRKSA